MFAALALISVSGIAIFGVLNLLSRLLIGRWRGGESGRTSD
jgi:ABC-type nitrate/sulfonate/bicarbonate transport system permease component